MPSNSAVLDVITGWSGQRPEKMSQNLEAWWNQTAPGSSHSTLKFDPDGIDDLLTRLKQTFPSSPRPSEADFRSGGNIATVQDLADALQPVMSDAPAAAPSEEKSVVMKGVSRPASKAPPPRKRATSPRKKSSVRKRSK
jgi:hypothetical protein